MVTANELRIMRTHRAALMMVKSALTDRCRDELSSALADVDAIELAHLLSHHLASHVSARFESPEEAEKTLAAGILSITTIVDYSMNWGHDGA